ncbi:MAG: hypothetical protein KKA05_11015, partial [Alphaproteobacteria bacterium]|nr:hypothetical protein [Alphaproteobacteria bacterium]
MTDKIYSSVHIQAIKAGLLTALENGIQANYGAVGQYSLPNLLAHLFVETVPEYFLQVTEDGYILKKPSGTTAVNENLSVVLDVFLTELGVAGHLVKFLP